jgi:hypothetical protein
MEQSIGLLQIVMIAVLEKMDILESKEEVTNVELKVKL